MAQESSRVLRESEGPMFWTVTKKGAIKKATIGDLDILFHDILRQVQTRFPANPPSKREDKIR